MARSTPKYLLELVEPVVNAVSCELWGLEYHASGRRRGVLRVYIDKPDGVDLSDCEKVSRQVSSVLDVEDPIQSEYTLEVSSPGMDRPLYTLEQFAQFVGENIKVRLRAPFDGRRHYKGRLTGVEDDEVKVLVDDHEYLLPIESIDRANVVPGFSDLPGKKGRGK